MYNTLKIYSAKLHDSNIPTLSKMSIACQNAGSYEVEIRCRLKI